MQPQTIRLRSPNTLYARHTHLSTTCQGAATLHMNQSNFPQSHKTRKSVQIDFLLFDLLFQKCIGKVTLMFFFQRAWFSVSTVIHPKGVLSSLGQDSMEARQAVKLVHPYHTLSSISLWTLLCALVHGYVGRGRATLRTVPTRLHGSKENGIVQMYWCYEAFRVHLTETLRGLIVHSGMRARRELKSSCTCCIISHFPVGMTRAPESCQFFINMHRVLNIQYWLIISMR